MLGVLWWQSQAFWTSPILLPEVKGYLTAHSSYTPCSEQAHWLPSSMNIEDFVWCRQRMEVQVQQADAGLVGFLLCNKHSVKVTQGKKELFGFCFQVKVHH